mmetsp:Transcript_136842/g.425084  ORF Transcript_136842/g.425084 Transcript_136842/m.425084 type:complete len:243 (-) Transcript_136842:694-1422(-)
MRKNEDVLRHGHNHGCKPRIKTRALCNHAHDRHHDAGSDGTVHQRPHEARCCQQDKVAQRMRTGAQHGRYELFNRREQWLRADQRCAECHDGSNGKKQRPIYLLPEHVEWQRPEARPVHHERGHQPDMHGRRAMQGVGCPRRKSERKDEDDLLLGGGQRATRRVLRALRDCAGRASGRRWILRVFRPAAERRRLQAPEERQHDAEACKAAAGVEAGRRRQEPETPRHVDARLVHRVVRQEVR